MKTFEIIMLPQFSDDRGETIPLEVREQLPFLLERVYWITGRPGHVRGGHAHRVEEEAFVAVSGSVTARVNDGTGDHDILLDTRNKLLVVRKKCWHEFFDFSEDAVLLCLSSTSYMPGDENYITDKKAFMASL